MLKIVLGIFIFVFTIFFLSIDSLTYKNQIQTTTPILTQLTPTAKNTKAIDESACIGCHGDRWEKIALSKSKVVSQMDEKEILHALLGYKNHTYGSDMKNIMNAQLRDYSDEEIVAFAKKLANRYSKVRETKKNIAVNELACFGCHGEDWSKRALGSSKIVAQMSHEEIANALIGYKNGTFGGDKKNLMRAQVGKYSEDELREFAYTIGL